MVLWYADCEVDLQVPSEFGDVIGNILNKLGNRALKSDLKSAIREQIDEASLALRGRLFQSLAPQCIKYFFLEICVLAEVL